MMEQVWLFGKMMEIQIFAFLDYESQYEGA